MDVIGWNQHVQEVIQTTAQAVLNLVERKLKILYSCIELTWAVCDMGKWYSAESGCIGPVQTAIGLIGPVHSVLDWTALCPAMLDSTMPGWVMCFPCLSVSPPSIAVVQFLSHIDLYLCFSATVDLAAVCYLELNPTNSRRGGGQSWASICNSHLNHVFPYLFNYSVRLSVIPSSSVLLKFTISLLELKSASLGYTCRARDLPSNYWATRQLVVVPLYCCTTD